MDNIGDNHDFDESSWETYSKSTLNQIITFLGIIMANQLRQILHNSLLSFMSIVKRYLFCDPIDTQINCNSSDDANIVPFRVQFQIKDG